MLLFTFKVNQFKHELHLFWFFSPDLRDLKPSNIFLTEELNVSIGDFGVATVMGDARTRTRTTVGKHQINYSIYVLILICY